MCSDTTIDIKRSKSRDTTGTNMECEMEAEVLASGIKKIVKVIIKKLLRTIKALLLIKI